MKVLLVFFGDDYHGGTTFSTLTIAKELVRRGHEVHAFARVTKAGVLARDLATCGVVVHDGRAPIQVHPLRESRPLWRVARFGLEQVRRFVATPAAERELARIVAECGIELVAISSGAITSGARAARAAGVGLVWHVREFMQEDHGLDQYPWAHTYERMDGADCLICVSQAVAEKMVRVCPHARVEVVYNGIDTELFSPEGRVERGEGEPLRLMFSGGISESKGTFVLLDALAQLGVGVPVRLDVFGRAGSGAASAEAFVARVAELGLGERVAYRGMTTAIADEYRCHDVLVVASRAEAFGRVTAEAMLCGCAVVGSNAGGTPELLADGRGYLFEPGDAASLAGELARVAGDSDERAARTARALEFARERFSVGAYVDQVEEIYQSVVGS